MKDKNMDTINQGYSLLFKANYNEAISLYQEYFDNGGNDLNQYCYLGLAYLLNEDYEAAQDTWMAFLFSTNEFLEQNTVELVNILENFVFENLETSYPNCKVINKIITAILDINDNYCNSKLIESINKKIGFLKKEALLLTLSNKLDESRTLYEDILSLTTEDSEILYQLGMVYYELEEYDKAQEKIDESLCLNPESSLCYDGLGMILEAKNEYNQAIKAYAYAIEYNEKNTESYIKLANLLKKFNLFSEAESVYENAITNEIKHSAIYMNFANLLVENEQAERAIELYKKAIELQNNYSVLYYNLALALEKTGNVTEALLHYGRQAYYEGRLDDAIGYFEQYRQTGNGDLDFYNEIGFIYLRHSEHTKVIEVHEEGIRKYSDSIYQRVYLISGYHKIGYYDKAIQVVDEAIAFFKPEQAFIFQGYKQSLLPIIYDSIIEIEQTRQNFLTNLNTLIEQIKLETEEEKKYAYFLARNRNNYYLHFHGENDLIIQIQYANFVAKIMNNVYPEFSNPIEIPQCHSEDKIRIGYICHRTHALGQLFLGWIKYCNRDKFEIYVYDIGAVIAPQTESFRIHSDIYHHIPRNIKKVIQQIREDSLHILTFLDISIEPEMCCLSTLKLAPIQCSTWGHPITSGSSQIDYFLGSDAMEPSDAQEHYSEELIRLPNLGICIPQPSLPDLVKTNSDFSLPENKILYLSCQMTAKYLPQYDVIFPEIAKLVPNAYFVFFEAYESKKITEKFKQRLNNIFSSYNLELENFCQFIPRLSTKDYLNIHLLSDVFLDTIGWSGGLTTLDAIACCLPIVTLPTAFMRGRQSYGMLKIIDSLETVASNLDEYIEIAARLALDSDWNTKIRHIMKNNKDRLFDDRSCIEALERFYETKIRQ